MRIFLVLDARKILRLQGGRQRARSALYKYCLRLDLAVFSVKTRFNLTVGNDLR